MEGAIAAYSGSVRCGVYRPPHRTAARLSEPVDQATCAGDPPAETGEGVENLFGPTRAETNLAPFEYIDGFYNLRRVQKRLGYLSSLEYEEEHYADQATAEQANLKSRQPTLAS